MEAKKADGISISLLVSDAYLQGSFTFKLTREPLWLVASDLPAYLNESVQELLRIKMEVPELQFIPKADVINTFIEEELLRFKEKIRSLPEERRQGYDERNTLFLKYLR